MVVSAEKLRMTELLFEPLSLIPLPKYRSGSQLYRSPLFLVAF